MLSIETGVVTDYRKIVITNGKDAIYPIAESYASGTHQEIYIWDHSSDIEIEKDDRNISFTLLISITDIKDKVIDCINEQVRRSYPGAIIGIVTGKDIGDIERQLEESTRYEEANNWILADSSLTDKLDCNLLKLSGKDDKDLVAGKINQPAQFGIVIGHGREDVIYFKNFAFCGMDVHGLDNPICNSDSCPYPQPKFHSHEIGASSLALISCSAAKVYDGLFPIHYNLGLSFLTTGVKAILAPYKLFSFAPAIVEYLTNLFESGLSIGHICRELNNWQENATGERPFIVLGNPNFIPSPKPFKTAGLSAREYPNYDNEETGNFREGLRKIYEGLDFLRAFDFVDPELEGAFAFFNANLNRFSKYIHSSFLNTALRRDLPILQEKISHIVDEYQEKLLDTLVEKSLTGYMWLSSYYNWFLHREKKFIQCPVCSSSAVQDVYQHPLKPYLCRQRKTCNRCGIIEDIPKDESSLVVRDLSVEKAGNGFKVTFRLSSAIPYDGVIGMAVNNGKKFFSGPVAYMKNKRIKLPARFSRNDKPAFEFNLETLNFGVYYLKVFYVSNMQLFIASCPVRCFDRT